MDFKVIFFSIRSNHRRKYFNAAARITKNHFGSKLPFNLFIFTHLRRNTNPQKLKKNKDNNHAIQSHQVTFRYTHQKRVKYLFKKLFFCQFYMRRYYPIQRPLSIRQSATIHREGSSIGVSQLS